MTSKITHRKCVQYEHLKDKQDPQVTRVAVVVASNEVRERIRRAQSGRDIDHGQNKYDGRYHECDGKHRQQ